MTVGVGIRSALKEQLVQYDRIEQEAHRLAAQRGWELDELNPAIRYMTNAMSRGILRGSRIDSKAAAMMIRGNTRGSVKSIRNLHRYKGHDSAVAALTQRLIDCENASVRQMEEFL